MEEIGSCCNGGSCGEKTAQIRENPGEGCTPEQTCRVVTAMHLTQCEPDMLCKSNSLACSMIIKKAAESLCAVLKADCNRALAALNCLEEALIWAKKSCEVESYHRQQASRPASHDGVAYLEDESRL